MLPKDTLEAFKLGRKWWRELQRPTEVSPDQMTQKAFWL